ncbi:MAG: OmpA family protein [Rhodobacteraceae bacterium]|nr:OmpA family protein [Paracoccaceae bacterium]MCY4141366.1 OmpA family protein [Paracoccaceae bacterium]
MRRLLFGVVLAIGVGPNISVASVIPCEDVVARWKQTTDATSLEEWGLIYEDAYIESDCRANTYAKIGQDIIDKFLPGIWRSFVASDDIAQLQAMSGQINALGEYGADWRIPFMEGEIARKMRDPRAALGAYQHALSLLDDEELTPEPPPEEEVALLRDRLDEVSVVVAQIAPDELGLPITRAGRLISQYSFSTRGYGRRKALVPIQFEYARDVMTGGGRSSFQEVFQTLKSQGSPGITIVGHTDPIGSSSYNLGLSRKRADAIRRELLALNYSGSVETRGMGEEQPFVFDDPGLYGEDVRNQAHRRVEILLRQP